MKSGRNKLYVIIAIIFFVLCGIFYMSTRRKPEPVVIPASNTPEIEALAEQPLADPTPTPVPLIKVHVAGAVVSPGVYTLEKGSRAEDAITMAGGFDEDADTASINLAAVVHDGQQLLVRLVGEAPVAGSSNILESGGKININNAPKEELMLLPGIGETLAGAVIQYREANGGFAAIQEIMNVPKIGEKTFANLEPFITVD